MSTFQMSRFSTLRTPNLKGLNGAVRADTILLVCPPDMPDVDWTRHWTSHLSQFLWGRTVSDSTFIVKFS